CPQSSTIAIVTAQLFCRASASAAAAMALRSASSRTALFFMNLSVVKWSENGHDRRRMGYMNTHAEALCGERSIPNRCLHLPGHALAPSRLQCPFDNPVLRAPDCPPE